MIKFFTFLLFLLMVVTSVMLYVTQNKISDVANASEEQGQGQAQIGGEFALTNQDGVQTANKDFSGKIMLVFFGFTNCPDVCPIAVGTYAKVLESLGDKANSVAPIFITVDPEYDTPEALKAFLGNIDKRIIGLTGTKEQIKQATDAYKTYSSISKNESGEEQVNHSSFVYLMDKNGVYVQHFPHDASPQDITNAINSILK